MKRYRCVPGINDEGEPEAVFTPDPEGKWARVDSAEPTVIVPAKTAKRLAEIQDHVRLNWPGGGDDDINSWVIKLRKLVGLP